MKKILTRFQPSPAPTPGTDFGTDETGRFPIYIILENIRSLYNVGSIFRTSDAARIHKIFTTGITGHPPRKEIAKTALGAQDTVPWEHCNDSREIIQRLKSDGVTIVAVEHTDESISFWEAEFSFPVCFIFGFEVEGIMQETLNQADFAVSIPMFGHKGSLNVAVSAGVILFEALRRLKPVCQI